jgi:VanZ family protein
MNGPGVEGGAAVGRRGRIGVALWIAAALYAALIFWLSSQSNPLPFLPSAIFSLDKVLHAGEYAVLGAVLRLALAATRLRARTAFLAAVAAASLYGASDEWHQAFVPNRSCDVRDWVADTGGALAGATLAALFLRRRGGAGSIRA